MLSDTPLPSYHAPSPASDLDRDHRGIVQAGSRGVSTRGWRSRNRLTGQDVPRRFCGVPRRTGDPDLHPVRHTVVAFPRNANRQQAVFSTSPRLQSPQPTLLAAVIPTLKNPHTKGIVDFPGQFSIPRRHSRAV